MSVRSMKVWSWLHTWTSLICTLFMLLLCLTGLPLIFHHEIGHLVGTEIEAPEMPENAPHISLDKVMQIGEARHPGQGGMFISREPDDDRVWYLTMSDTPTSTSGLHQVAIDARTGDILGEPQLESGFMYIINSLHIDLFAGLPGMLFLGLMGVLLLISLISGAVLYAPFMQKLAFGEVRRQRTTRLKWLDLHNLLGIITLVWFLVVGGTGVLNAWADLIVKAWQNDQLSTMLEPYQGKQPPQQLGSLEAAVQSARHYLPDMQIQFVAFPGTSFSSPHHYGVFMHGNQALTAHLSQPVLIDASTSQVTDSRPLPWYFTALQLSRPLHFGDYGGKALQIIWAILDVITIILLGSGLYLWLAKRSRRKAGTTSNTRTGLKSVSETRQ